MDHKIVCWGDYAIPVPVKAKWLARNLSGNWYAYKRKPQPGSGAWLGSIVSCVSKSIIIPPEPGHWEEQLYWIGD